MEAAGTKQLCGMIQEKAILLGFDDVGITSAEIHPEDRQALTRWLAEKKHADLSYMENKLRLDPKEYFPGAKSAILFVTYYKQEKLPFQKDLGLIASYARGRDYHNIHRKRLKKMIQWLEDTAQQKNIAKGFSDASPVMEKALAVQAGLGFFGKNTLLIHRKFGTFILLSGILTTLDLKPSSLQLRQPRCGSCTRCLDACPTQAIEAPYRLNAARCLSYHLIESKKAIPSEIREKNPGYIFGCDVCQDVCPHNSRKPLSLHEEFQPEKGLGEYLGSEELSKLQPESLFGTPLGRRKLPGLWHNLNQTEN